jgi:hypothetical protein
MAAISRFIMDLGEPIPLKLRCCLAKHELLRRKSVESIAAAEQKNMSQGEPNRQAFSAFLTETHDSPATSHSC